MAWCYVWQLEYAGNGWARSLLHNPDDEQLCTFVWA